MSDAPERVGVKRTDGYEYNWWGVLTNIFDEDAVEYVRADIADEKIADLTRELAEARDKALEEAAKVAEATNEDAPEDEQLGDEFWTLRVSCNTRSTQIARKIRALKEKP